MKKIYENWLKIIFLYNLVFVIVTGAFYFVVPTIMAYPPGSINNQFQIDVNALTYNMQYFSIVFGSFLLENIILTISIIKLNKLRHPLKTANKSESTSIYYKVSKLMLNTPNIVYFVQMLIPILMIISTFSMVDGDLSVTVKVYMLFFSIITLMSSISYIFSIKIFRKILVEIFNEFSGKLDVEIKFTKYIKKTSMIKLIFMVTIPIFTVTGFLIALVGYTSVIEETGDLSYRIYDIELESLQISSFYSNDALEILKEKLDTIELDKEGDLYFIQSPSGEIYTSNGTTLSEFFIRYIDEIAPYQEQINRTYDFYGDDSQGIFKKININGEEWIIGIRYTLMSNEILFTMMAVFGALCILNILLISYFASFISSEIKRVSDALLKISKSKDVNLEYKLPIVSNDEIGELVHAYHKIQTLTKQNIKQIYNGQETLMEKERLASLGQLIGGIAHNLKTPIMSISGAAEGINILVEEYKKSVGDKDVDLNDHYEIAAEMNDWIKKIKTHTEYMSDVITTVKGQSVNFVNDESITFEVGELVKRINILMKHELKHSVTYLNYDIKVDERQEIRGDINSLIQVINNMISNSIQAYNGKVDQTIDFKIEKVKNELRISIKDYGEGLPDNVKNKLFKEMITTKGKNGTGLGLYMSYSTIKANFHGEILLESEKGKGTKFTIILPV